MERPEVLNKLAKLLSKTVANGATEAESQTALVMAQRLMDEHNLTAAEVTLDGGAPAGMVEATAWESKSADSHYLSALRVVEQVFAVTGVARRYMLRFKGRKATAKVEIRLYGDAVNVEAAGWALHFLATTFRRLWDRHRAATGATSDRLVGYLCGVERGFLDKTRADRADLERALPGSGRALALLAGRTHAAAAAANPGLEVVVQPVNDTSSYAAGYRDGQTVNLARPVEQARRASLTGS